MQLEKLYRIREVCALTGMPVSSIYADIKKGEFPAPVKLRQKGRAVAWRGSDLAKWSETRTQRITSPSGNEPSSNVK